MNAIANITPRDYHETLQHDHPMAAARIVRRDHCAWPGGYALALITTDGGALCPDCVTREFHLIASAHRGRDGSGWQPAGIACEAGTDEALNCGHCNGAIFDGNEDEEDSNA